MKNAIKGALFSGLIFPGAGQFVLKKYTRGMALMLTASVCVFYIVKQAVAQATSILERLDIQNGAVDINAITNAATQASANSSGLLVNVAFLLIFASWIFGIVDAYRIGKSMDNKKIQG